MKDKNRTFKVLFYLAVIFLITSIVLVFCGPEFTQARFYDFKTIQEKGSAGDNFSGMLSPVIAWIAALLTFAAFYIQYEANELQKEYNKRQGFEDTFFRLFENHQRIVESMDLRSTKDPTRIFAIGRDCFKRMYRQFESKHKKLYAEDTNITVVKITYNTIQEHYKSDLHHYFRFLYHILKFVKHSDLDDDEKYKYTSILRAALSPYELIFIFYNCLHEYGETHFKPLVEEFSFLKNMDDELLFDLRHEKEFHELAFASSNKRKKIRQKWENERSSKSNLT